MYFCAAVAGVRLINGDRWWHFRTAGLGDDGTFFCDETCLHAKRQVNRAAENLRALGLLDEPDGNTTPRKKHHHLWRDAEELVNPRIKKDVGYPNSREYLLECLRKYDCLFYKGKGGDEPRPRQPRSGMPKRWLQPQANPRLLGGGYV